jgi:hypothetical protein
MACESIRSRLASLERQASDIESVLPSLQGAGLASATENLANIRAEITTTEAELAECEQIADRDPEAPRQPFSAEVQQLRCLISGPEVGDQEPYLIIATVDMLAGAGLVPDLHTVLVGPWSGVRSASSPVAAPGDVSFWDLNGDPKELQSAEDAIFLAGLIENDGASPDAIRGAVQSALRVSLLSNIGRDYDTLADTMRSAMVGAIDSALGLGIGPSHLNFDDRVAARHVDLSTEDLDAIDVLGAISKEIGFRRTKNNGDVQYDYEVTFRFAVPTTPLSRSVHQRELLDRQTLEVELRGVVFER